MAELDQILCMLPTVSAWSSSGGVIAIHYVLPVLWITSCFHIMALWRVMRIPKRLQNTTSMTAKVPNKFTQR